MVGCLTVMLAIGQAQVVAARNRVCPIRRGGGAVCSAVDAFPDFALQSTASRPTDAE